jgi:MoaA/NifB/PqqE/SkfB family radical SAM enzyme
VNRARLKTLLGYPIKRYGTCMFAVTSRCNGRCKFCSIPSEPHNGVISPDQLHTALRQLHALGVRYIQFTGGEPLLYPHLVEAIEVARELGLLATVVTNGSRLDARSTKALARGGVQSVSISVDHYDSAVLAQNRGIADLAQKIQEGVQLLRGHGLPVQASTTISKLLDLRDGDYLRLVEHNRQVGFDGTYFCYPMTDMRSNYALGGDIVRFERGELAEVIAHIKSLKRQKYPIDNSYETLDDVLAFLANRPSRFPCVAGYKVFYLDWDLRLYGCMTKGNLIVPILELDTAALRLPRVECEECILSCDREPSIYQHGARSIGPFLRLLGDTLARGVSF